MKKFILTIMLMGFVFIANSQQVLKTNTEPFRPGWNIGVNGGINFYMAEGNNFLNPNQGSYFSLKDNTGLIGRLSLGYDFTKVIGLRGFVGLAGHVWPDILFDPPLIQRFNAQNATIDLMVNLSNMWDGYDPNRLIDISAFGGVGVAHRNISNFSTEIYSPIGRVGFQGDIRLTNKLDLNVIAETNFVSDNYNDYIVSVPFDIYTAVTVGLTYRLAKEKDKQSPVQGDYQELQPKTELADKTVPVEPIAEPVAEPEQVAIQDPQPVEPVEVVAPKTETASVDQQATDLWVNIFYTINKKDIVKPRQKDQIAKVVDYLARYPEAKITVSGYADRGTGTAAINNTISKQRAENVTELLKTQYDIPADRIKTVWYGSRRQLFKQNDMNRLTTVNSEGAEPFKKRVSAAPQSQTAPSVASTTQPATEIQQNATTVTPSGLKEDIMFVDNTANLSDKKQNDAIMMIAVYLRNNPDAKIVVSGYADKTTGTADQNVILSKNRAVNVSNSLILKYSIDKSRIQVKWFGDGVQPYGSKSAKNRLVKVSTVNI